MLYTFRLQIKWVFNKQKTYTALRSMNATLGSTAPIKAYTLMRGGAILQKKQITLSTKTRL
jgi:hypothetical protein